MDNNNLISDGHPVPLIVFKDKKFIVDSEGERILKSEENKSIGIIALVGKYRTGKSFLLNRVLLNQKNQGFGVGPTIKPCTKGIWMWSKPIFVENNHSKEKFPVYLIDTEGLSAYDEEQNHDTKIFLISILISSLLILNSFGVIDESAINSLSFVLNLSKIIRLSNNPNDNSDLKKYFPSLFWLLRDFSLKLEDSEGNTITAKQYLENALKQQNGCSEQIEEKNKLRKMICSYFTERDCFTLVRPVENESDLQNLQIIEESSFRKEFLEQASLFRNKVFKKVKPKLFNGKLLSGEMMIHLLNSVIECINKGAIPVIENSWKYVCDNECFKVSNDVINSFKSSIRKFKEENKENLKFFGDFEAFQKTLIQQSIESFKANAIGNEQTEYEEKLRTQINNEVKRFNEENCRFYEKMFNDILDKNNKIIVENLEKDKYSKNYYDFFQDLEILKDNTETSTPDFPLKKEMLFSKMINIIKRFIEITFIKNKLHNEKEILHLKNDLTHITNKYKLKVEELENTRNELQTQIDKLTLYCNELKNKETTNFEAVKKADSEKKNLQNKVEKDLNAIKKDYDTKIEKLKTEISRVEHEIKQKDEQINSINFSNEKQNILNVQKIEFLETDINNLRLRAEQIKHENDMLKCQNNELEAKLESFKEELTKKKILEYENEKLKKQKETALFNKKIDIENSELKTQLENYKKQYEESKRNHEEMMDNIKRNINNPVSLAKIFVIEDKGKTEKVITNSESFNNGSQTSKPSIVETNPNQSLSSLKLNITSPQSNTIKYFNSNISQTIINSKVDEVNNRDNPPQDEPVEVIVIGGGDMMMPMEINAGGPETVIHEKEVLKCAGAGGEKEQNENKVITAGDRNAPINEVPQKPSRLRKGKSTQSNENIQENDKKNSSLENENHLRPIENNNSIINFLNENELLTENINKSSFKTKTQGYESKPQFSSTIDTNFYNNLVSNPNNQTLSLNNQLPGNSNITALSVGSNYQELLESNKILTQSLNKYENRCHNLEEKMTKLKTIKELIKLSGGLQCKHCSKFYSLEEYEDHVDHCNTENSVEYHKTNDKIRIKILKGVLRKDSCGKPFIEYIVDINFDHHNWNICRKFNQFSGLHKQLKETFPEIHFPHSSKLFSKISDSSTNFHENKINLLENYMKEISEIYQVKTCKIFRNFLGLDEFTDNTDYEKINVLTEKSNITSKSTTKQIEVTSSINQKKNDFTLNEEDEQRQETRKINDSNYKSISKEDKNSKFNENQSYSNYTKKLKNISFS